MTSFIAIKVHYDHRPALPEHLKYSRAATKLEHREYLSLYRESGIGGNGFHECMNFALPEGGPVRIYLPPTCIPDEKRFDDDFVIFSFTYQNDPEKPSVIVGVHAGVTMLGRRGIVRTDVAPVPGIDRLTYNAEAPVELCTLLVPPLPYDRFAGTFTPKFQRWGYGLRNLTRNNARRIVQSALTGAMLGRKQATGSRRLALERQVAVLEQIKDKYFLGVNKKTSLAPAKRSQKRAWGGNASPPLPDQELGRLGEQEVFNREVRYLEENRIGNLKDVEWTSQTLPASPYDIETVRRVGKQVVAHYLEVKSSRVADGSNTFISTYQLDHLREHPGRASVVLVTFDVLNKVKAVRYLTLAELEREFTLVPFKYKLRRN